MTAAVNYENLVTQTFCDNSIRSVMMIDDEFLPYPTLIEAIKSSQNLDPKLIANSSRAAELEKFFQSKNILCDIDNSAEHTKWDKIRKSDLIVIDYYLDGKSPKKTLDILNDLQSSEHMNLAVVYTNELIEDVWKQIASTLVKKHKTSDVIAELDIDDLETSWEKIEQDDTYILSNEEISHYLNTKVAPQRIIDIIKGDTDLTLISSEIKTKYDSPDEDFKILDNLATLVCNYQLEQISNEFGINPTIESGKFISNKNGNKWIKINNIFICLVNKIDSSTRTETPPQKIWDTLTESLIEWKPTYYQLMQSEIQNFIESEALAFNKRYNNEILGQAAWLNEIIKSDKHSQQQIIKSIYKNLSEDLYFKFNKSTSLNSYIEKIFKHYKDKSTADKLRFCANEMGVEFTTDTPLEMYHALNMHLSSKNYEEKFISTGTVFFDETNNSWYLCVSAACDMVPTQGNDPHYKRLNPHRIIKVLKLFEVNNAKKAIKGAHNSQYIYITHNNSSLFFSIFDNGKNLPCVDYLIIKDHEKSTSHPNKLNAYMWLTNPETKAVELQDITLKLKSQLRSGYAERFQSIAGQYTSRIGVDYISAEVP
ncbi:MULTISPECIES: response regulator receiver domain [Acinetobacter]|uniref:response regulator receiver domain n=1 Tax=Acinetobacter TaxID=469 RepID=UPI0022E5201D|nr:MULTISPECIES: response regulator receiver domain [Acinetobacter]MDI1225754.1 response regulator receiver domain [Acinetobacter sp.]